MDLLKKLRDRTAVVSVIGLGYAGLPLAMAFADAGFSVLGVDVNPRRVDELNRGESPVEDVTEERLRGHLEAGRFRASGDYAALAEADTITISVPTPLGPGHLPDLSFIERAVDGLVPVLRQGQLVVLESTTYPGTTEELIQPRLEAGGRRAGHDFFLGFGPERIDPGGTTSGGLTFADVPKLVAGATPRCLECVAALYETIVRRVVPVSSLKTAEMAKLVENAFRMVNVGFANEVALWCHELGLDAWEVIDAAATKPFGFMAHYPGPGLGGHCIPVDPYYLVWKLKTLDVPARFIELAGEVNRTMPAFVVSKVQTALERRGRPLRGSRVLVLGVAYKRDVADTRESPSLDVLSLLIEHGAEVSYHDPHVPEVTVKLSERALVQAGGAADKEPVQRLERVELYPLAEQADCLVICTDHTAYDWETLASRARLIVDTRNALRSVAAPRAEVVKL
ncbi:MAG: UDP-N-acetyl-D-glucosamine 6-dehydrogenase [uncultured Chloroflexi bacterium]|uniref:UDP-N-acetyl-D-glucosamine 6-dehydrogenase n=1 Tax=uncultured Chloroflexota bacterium TaxID=166587 RepID=A0A6J4H715_9CHLR|nr:MAG: UDP-N-acetyl-D-glucosamine 6-dehydrogenase [uncultured Chloroflexota bacterium]